MVKAYQGELQWQKNIAEIELFCGEIYYQEEHEIGLQSTEWFPDISYLLPCGFNRYWFILIDKHVKLWGAIHAFTFVMELEMREAVKHY